MQTELHSLPGRIQTTERQIGQRARRLPRKGLMNENGLLGFLPPSRQLLPPRLLPPKENMRGLPTAELGERSQARGGRPRPRPPSGPWRAAAAPWGLLPTRWPSPLPRLATLSLLFAASRLHLPISWQPPLSFLTSRLNCLFVLLEGCCLYWLSWVPDCNFSKCEWTKKL